MGSGNSLSRGFYVMRNDIDEHGRSAYKKSLADLPEKLSLTDIRFAVALARVAIVNAYRHPNGQMLTCRHDLDTYGSGYWSLMRYRRTMLARFICNLRGVRV